MVGGTLTLGSCKGKLSALEPCNILAAKLPFLSVWRYAKQIERAEIRRDNRYFLLRAENGQTGEQSSFLCNSLHVTFLKVSPNNKFTIHICIILYNCSDEGFAPKKTLGIGLWDASAELHLPGSQGLQKPTVSFDWKKIPRMPWALQLPEVVPPRSQPKPMAPLVASTGHLLPNTTKNNGRCLVGDPAFFTLTLATFGAGAGVRGAAGVCGAGASGAGSNFTNSKSSSLGTWVGELWVRLCRFP